MLKKKIAEEDGGVEDWEKDAELFYAQEWRQLAQLRRLKYEREPKCAHTQWCLGEAYVLNGEYEKAIRFLGELHQKYPDDLNIQHSLLNALSAIGKDETDFEWILNGL